MLADTTVHTTSINWESVAVTAGAVLAIVGAFVTWIGNKITHAINDLSENLQGKLETKERVAAIDVRVVRIEQILTDIHERQINDSRYSRSEHGYPGDLGSSHSTSTSTQSQQ